MLVLHELVSLIYGFVVHHVGTLNQLFASLGFDGLRKIFLVVVISNDSFIFVLLNEIHHVHLLNAFVLGSW